VNSAGHGVAPTEEPQIQIQQARERGLIAPGEEWTILSAMELRLNPVREISDSRPDMHAPDRIHLDAVMRVFATTSACASPSTAAHRPILVSFIKDYALILLDRERRPKKPFSAA
jgi:hypothetical protein